MTATSIMYKGRKMAATPPPYTFTTPISKTHEFEYWKRDHGCSFPLGDFGDLTAKLTFSFTTTGIDTECIVTCECGEKFDLS